MTLAAARDLDWRRAWRRVSLPSSYSVWRRPREEDWVWSLGGGGEVRFVVVAVVVVVVVVVVAWEGTGGDDDEAGEVGVMVAMVRVVGRGVCCN